MGLPRHPLNFTQGLFLTGICAVPASLAVQRRGFLRLQPADFLVCRSSDFEDGNLAADSTLLLAAFFCFSFMYIEAARRNSLAPSIPKPD